MASITAAATDGSIFRRGYGTNSTTLQPSNWTAQNFRAGLLKLAGRFLIILTTSQDERYFLNDALRSLLPTLKQLQREKNKYPRASDPLVWHLANLQAFPEPTMLGRKTNPFFRREACKIKSLEQEDLCFVCGFCKLG